MSHPEIADGQGCFPQHACPSEKKNWLQLGI